MRRVLLGAVVLLVASACAVPGRAVPEQRPVPSTATAVGALFEGSPEDLGSHFCSAAVVDSRSGDVVITAAHCVADGDGTPARTGLSFVPGYHDGLAPYGVWTVRSVAVDPQFLADADPDYDVAFLTVVPAAGGKPVQQVTGGFPVAFDPGSGAAVEAIGYPTEDEVPTVRSGVTDRLSPTQLELAAPGLEGGTSGGPWLRTGSPDDAAIVGVTGGYEQGGLTFDTSYSTYLAEDFASLRKTADGSRA